MLSQIDEVIDILNDARGHASCIMSSGLQAPAISHACKIIDLLCQVQMQLISLRVDWILNEKPSVFNEVYSLENDCKKVRVAAI
jgi:hypothetical protein